MSLFNDTAPNEKEKSALIPFITFHTVTFLLFFIVLGHLFYHSPGALELDFAQKMLGGMMPYRDFPCEYPPLALLFFILPALILGTYPAYSVSFAIEILLLDIAVMVFIISLTSHLRISARRALTVYTLLLMAIGPIIIARYDMLPAMLSIATLWAFVKGKNITAWCLLAFGFTAKLYPVILAPLMALYLLRNKEFLKLIKGSASFIITLTILNLPFILLSPSGFLSFFTYHTKRGLQCESSYASFVLIEKVLGKVQVKGTMSYGSWNVVSPLADSFARVSFYITAVLLLAAYAYYAWTLWRMPETRFTSQGIPPREAGLLLGYTCLVIIIFLIANKVFSPQYLIWLLPLLPLLRTKWSSHAWLTFAIAGIITQYIFPYKYDDYEGFKTFYVLVLALRNVLIFVLGMLIMLAGNEGKAKLKAELGAVSHYDKAGFEEAKPLL